MTTMADGKERSPDHLVLQISGPQITAEKFELGVRSFLAIIKAGLRAAPRCSLVGRS